MKKLIFFLSMISFMLVGCEHKDLCYHHPHQCRLIVQFDWRDAPDSRPLGMTVYFYPVDEDGNQLGDPHRYDFRGTRGGEIDIPQGRYRAICYNNDSEVVEFRLTESFKEHYATTRTGNLFEPLFGSGGANGPKAQGSENEKIYITPDHLVGCSATEIEVNTTGVSYLCVPESEKDNWTGEPVYSPEQIITLYPHDMLCLYTYEIRNVKNMQYISQMSASLSGMSASLGMYGESLGLECVTLPLEAYKEGENRITGAFYTFGHHEANTSPHRLLLYVWLNNGQKIYFGASSPRFDVTQQIHESPDRRRVHIVIEGLDVPNPLGDGPGFDPSADDWQDEDHEIEI